MMRERGTLIAAVRGAVRLGGDPGDDLVIPGWPPGAAQLEGDEVACARALGPALTGDEPDERSHIAAHTSSRPPLEGGVDN